MFINYLSTPNLFDAFLHARYIIQNFAIQNFISNPLTLNCKCYIIIYIICSHEIYVSAYLTNTNPFLSANAGIQPLNDFELMDQLASSWADALLNSSSYGAAIHSYSSGWYTSLSDVEVLARAIYCEGGTAYTNEEDAVAWVILNRVNNYAYSNAPIDIVKQANRFSSITGGASSTQYSRIPSTNTERWKHSTYLACLLLTTTDTTKWKNIVGNPINGQLFFYSYTAAQSSSIFTGSNDALKYNGKDINNVQVLGYGFVSSFSTLFQQYNPIRYSRNIFYSLK